MGNNQNNQTLNIRIAFQGKTKTLNISPNLTVEELIKLYKEKYLNSNYKLKDFSLKINNIECSFYETIETYRNEINNNSIFQLSYDEDDFVIDKNNIKLECANNGDDDDDQQTGRTNESYDISKNNYDFEINIKFFKIDKNKFNQNFNSDLHGLLKLCLLKEMATSNDFENDNDIEELPKNISDIFKILKKGKINNDDVQKGILEILKKTKGGNIFNFAKYVDGLISQSDITNYIFPKLFYSKNDIIYIQNCLGKYVEYAQRFEEEFERAKRESVFEYSIISSTIIEREDIDKFEEYRENCPNRVDRVLFHGTTYDSISKILTDLFFISTNSCQHGKGVYFTEDLDSCWIYGSEVNSHIKEKKKSRNKLIPKVGQYFSFIASAIYYNKKIRVYDSSYDPKTNEMNYAFAEMSRLKTIKDPIPDKAKFYGTEFVIKDLNQICPFMSFKMKRDEYCIIWRDNNFSDEPVYNNKFDSIFKNFLQEKLEYLNKIAKFNIYPCKTSEEALELVNRKKYNKIILISNIGTDLGGKKFVEEARKIIGNNTIVLFNAYRKQHLNWVKNFRNALFSNEPSFYEQYLDCFYGENEDECKHSILELKKKFEKHYKITFNFDKRFLYFPNTENSNIEAFKDLEF